MPATAPHTLVCSVLFLDIEGYSRRPVSEQLILKQRFNTLLLDALAHVAEESRLLLDTGDGAAVGFLGAPEDALFTALGVHEGCAGQPPAEPALRIRMGINLGPVRLLKDINGRSNLIGDGINDAQRVMSFAAPGSILASRAYYEVVSRISGDYARLFAYQGVRTDKHVREHAIYAVGAPEHPPREALTADPLPSAAATPAAPAARRGPPRALLLGALLAALLAFALYPPGGGPEDIQPPPTDSAPAAPLASPAPAPASAPPPADARHADADVFRPARPAPRSNGDGAWLAELRRELAECAARNFLQSGVCAERVRWKHCAPDRWDSVEECRVDQGAKPPGQS